MLTLTPNALSQAFKDELTQTLAHYQASCPDEQVPPHRVADINAIRMALKALPRDVETARHTIQSVLDTIHTGWWIFGTGRSALKEGILAVLSKSQYSEMAFLKANLIDIQQQMAGLMQAQLPNDADARQALKEARQTIDSLEAQTARLDADNARLVQENDELKAKNARLAAALQQSATRRHTQEKASHAPDTAVQKGVKQTFEGRTEALDGDVATHGPSVSKQHPLTPSTIAMPERMPAGKPPTLNTQATEATRWLAAIDFVDSDTDTENSGYESPGMAMGRLWRCAPRNAG